MSENCYNKELFMQHFNKWFSQRQSNIQQRLIEFINDDTSTPNEKACFEKVTRYLEEIGFNVSYEMTHPELRKHPSFSPHKYSQMTSERGNLRARLKSIPDHKKVVLFNCHLDVVPGTNDFENAFKGYVENGKIFGRGACDTKNNLIMLGEAIRFLKDKNISFKRIPAVDLVIEEEIGGNGTLSTILNGIDADEVICLEPTSLEVFRGHRGCISFQVEVPGISVHMGSDSYGINAIEWTFEIIKSLKSMEKGLLEEAKSDPDFNIWERPLQLNIGMISGGEWTGSVPERCVLAGDLGFLPKYSLNEIESIIELACRNIDNKWVSDNLKVVFNGLRNDAYIIPGELPLVKDLILMADIVGLKQNRNCGWKVSCDARYYAKDCNIPVVIFGSGSLSDAHSAHECIDFEELRKGSCIVAGFISGMYEEV